MTTFLFRVNGGEVLGISVDPNTYSDLADPFLDSVVNPSTPDGENLVPTKIWDLTNVRNATAPEIANFVVAADADQVESDKQDAQDLIELQGVFRRSFKAVILALIEEVNVLRALHSLPPRTLTQAVNSIKEKISDGTVS